jgi:hypothetical protein
MNRWYRERGYPLDWEEQIRPPILTRASGRCECRGECGVSHAQSVGSAAWYIIGSDDAHCGLLHESLRFSATANELVRVILTIAHRDHDPRNCDDDNLRAWCEPCHLRYDGELHRERKRLAKQRGQSYADTIAATASLYCLPCRIGRHVECRGDDYGDEDLGCCCWPCAVKRGTFGGQPIDPNVLR